jgi:hypothetical protein
VTAASQQTPAVLEVLAHVPTDLFHCRHCEQAFGIAGIGATVHREIQSSYPAWVLEEARRLTALLEDLAARYGERLHIHIVDVGSVEGFLKSLRYGVRRYPAFVINSGATVTGWDTDALIRLVRDAADDAESA